MGTQLCGGQEKAIGIAIMRACADSVITQFAKSPHAALTAKKRFNAFAIVPPPPPRPLRRRFGVLG